jgi:hypothetical protein
MADYVFVVFLFQLIEGFFEAFFGLLIRAIENGRRADDGGDNENDKNAETDEKGFGVVTIHLVSSPKQHLLDLQSIPTGNYCHHENKDANRNRTKQDEIKLKFHPARFCEMVTADITVFVLFGILSITNRTLFHIWFTSPQKIHRLPPRVLCIDRQCFRFSPPTGKHRKRGNAPTGYRPIALRQTGGFLWGT